MFQTNVVEKIKTDLLCSITFFPKIVLFMTYCKKYIVEPDRPLMTIEYGACLFILYN